MEGRGSFLKKRTKKLLVIGFVRVAHAGGIRAGMLALQFSPRILV